MSTRELSRIILLTIIFISVFIYKTGGCMFKKILVLLFLLGFLNLYASNKMLVRIHTDDYRNLKSIDLKSIDIAGRKYNEYFDIVVTAEEYSKIIVSGLRSEIISEDIVKLKEEYRANYHSYDEVTGILRNLASTYPSICKLDSIGQSYEGRWVYAAKISDNPGMEDSTEPGILFDALHHSREWATIEAILFYADTLTKGYGNDPVITDLIDNNEIWLIPIVNVDGYVYDYPEQNMWRKNRKPFLGEIGTDPNRNYNGCLNGDPYGDWCSVPSGGSMSNNPSSDVFCGAYSGFADVVQSMMEFHRIHDINVNITYHSYAEEIIWPWAYNASTTYQPTPDSTVYENIANEMASRIQRVGGGNYVASGSLYPNTGTTRSWVYGYHHYLKGTSCLSYTIEIGTAFYQSVSDLDFISRENWEGALYLAQRADSIREFVLANVPSPSIYTQDSVASDTVIVNWFPIQPEWNHPDMWELEQLKDYSYSIDSMESGTGNWILSGFSQNSTRHYSGSYSFYSGSGNNISNVAMTKHPYLVCEGDSLSFWCWYDLETNYDVSVVEISTDKKEWIQIDERYSGTSGGWINRKYDLSNWVDKSVYIRFRISTDDGVLNEGFYIDDVYPVASFGSIYSISSTISDTFYTVSGLSNGKYYFRVRGYNARGWGNYSNIVKTVVNNQGVKNRDDDKNNLFLDVKSNLKNVVVYYSLLANTNVEVGIFDISGRMFKSIRRYDKMGNHKLNIDIKKSGIFFIKVRVANKEIIRKVVVLQ